MKVGQIVQWLNGIAPFDSAESFDNVGLLLGDETAEVTSVMFGLDLTEALADAAIVSGADLIITHHPFIFHAMKRISYSGAQGRTLMKLLENRIAVIAAHTNWDKASGGVSDTLAAKLGLTNVFAADDYVRVGRLSTPLSTDSFSKLVEDNLSIIPRIYSPENALIETVAVAGGSYGEGWRAAFFAGAQVFVVGEISHHEILDAFTQHLTVCDAGHAATERPGVAALYQRFLADAAACGWSIEARLYDKPPYSGAFLA